MTFIPSSGGAGGGLSIVQETNFITAANQDLTTSGDGQYVIDGLTYEISNTGLANTFAVDANGLTMDTSSGSSANGLWASFYIFSQTAAWNLNSRWRLTVRFSRSNTGLTRISIGNGILTNPINTGRDLGVSFDQAGTWYPLFNINGFSTISAGRTSDNIYVLENRGVGQSSMYVGEHTGVAGTLPLTTAPLAGLRGLTDISGASDGNTLTATTPRFQDGANAPVSDRTLAQAFRLIFGTTDAGVNNTTSIEAFRIESE